LNSRRAVVFAAVLAMIGRLLLPWPPPRTLEGLASLLERSGFEGFKVQLVLREAGVSARAFYRHFGDKDELMLALLQEEMARAGAHIRAQMLEIDDPVEQELSGRQIRTGLGLRSGHDAIEHHRHHLLGELAFQSAPVQQKVKTPPHLPDLINHPHHASRRIA